MAATPGGGGGGRSFPVYIDLITRGADQAISGLNGISAAATKAQTASTGVARGADTVASSSQNMGRAVAGASANMQSSASGAAAMSRNLHSVQQQTQATAGSMGEVSQSTGQATRQMGRARAGFDAFRNAGRGAQFAIIGLIGSVNEAVFMIERTIDANNKVAVAQAEVNRLTAEGEEGTAVYSRAVKDLEDAQRGAQFTSRIMAQSVLDNVTFMGMLGSQLPKVIAEYRRLRGSTVEANAAMGMQGGILTRLRTALSNFSGGLIPLPSITRSVSQSIQQMGTSAAASGSALSSLAGDGSAVSTSMTPLARATGQTAVAMRGLGPAAASAGAGLLPLATNMRTVDATARTIIPSLNLVPAAVTRMGTASLAAAGATVPLATGMRAVDATSKSILPTLNLLPGTYARVSTASLAAAGATVPLIAGMKAVDTTSKSATVGLYAAGSGATKSGIAALLGAGGWHAFTVAMMNAGRASYKFLLTPMGLIVTAIAAGITAIIALNQNWGNMRTELSKVSVSVKEAYGDFGMLWEVLKVISPPAAFIDIAEQMEKTATSTEGATKTAEEMKETLTTLNEELEVSVSRLQGFSGGWKEALRSANQYISDVSTSFFQFGSSLEQQIASIQQQLSTAMEVDPTGKLKESLDNTLGTLQDLQTGVETTYNRMNTIINDGTLNWKEKWTEMGAIALQLPNQLADIPSQFQPVVQNLATELDKITETMPDGVAKAAQIMEAAITGQITPAVRELVNEIGGPLKVAFDDFIAMQTDSSTTTFAAKQNVVGLQQETAILSYVTHAAADALEEEKLAADEANNSFARLKDTWATARTELQPLVNEMGIFLASFSHSDEVIAGLERGLTNYNKTMHETRVEKIALGVQTAMLAGGEALLNQLLLEGTDALIAHGEANQHLVDTTTEAGQAVREKTAAQEIAIMAAERETQAITGLNVESQRWLQSNQEIILAVEHQTQAFDENAVMIAAHASGLQTWRDAQAEAYFGIVETATALGFQGDMTRANISGMLEHIAVTERQNEANTTAVEGYFSLSDAQQLAIDSSGEMAIRLGEVAIGAEKVRAADAALIAEQVRLNEANQDAVETWLSLDESQRATLATMGITPQIMQQVMDGTLTLTDAMIQLIEEQGKAAEAADAHQEAIAGLLPGFREYAEVLGLVNLTAEQLTPVQQAVTQHVIDLDSAFGSAIQNTVNFVAEQGKIGEIVGMNTVQLAQYIATMDLSNESMKSAAEIAQEASQALADAWEADLERAAQAWETSSSAFATAAENISDEIGDAGAEGAAKFTEGFLTEFVPQQVIEEAFDKNIDIEDLIDDIKDEAEDKLEDGLISDVAMRDAIEPMLAEMEKIPGETEYHMGEMIAIARHTMTQLKPVLVGGIHEVGRDAVSAFETGVFQPLQDALEAGGGTGVWEPLITNFSAVVDALPDEYDRMKGDFNKMLELTKGDTRAQINAILPILREINPEWAAIVEEMDTDGDTIKDMFDDKISSPAQEMRRELVGAFADIFDAWALVMPGFDQAAQHLRDLLAETEATGSATAGLTGEWLKLAERFNMTAGEINNLRANFHGYNLETGAGVLVNQQWIDSLNEMDPLARQNAINWMEAALGIDLFADGVETEAIPAVKSVTTAFGTWSEIPGLVGMYMNDVTGEIADFSGVAAHEGQEAVQGYIWEWDNELGMWKPVAVLDEKLEETVTAAATAGGNAASAYTSAFAAVMSAHKLETGENWTGAVPNLLPPGTKQREPTAGEGTPFGGVAMEQEAIHEAGGAGETVPPPNFSEADAAWAAYEGRVATIMTNMTANVQAHTDMMTQHFAYHAQQVGVQVNITGQHLTRLVQGYNLMTMGVQTATTLMAVSWVGHVAMVGAQVNASGMHLLRYVQGYNLTVMGVQQAMTLMAVSWVGHALMVGAQVNATGMHLLRLVQGYGLTITGVTTALTTMAILWVGHATAVGIQVGAINTHLGTLNGFMAAAAGSVLTQLTNMSIYWVGHATSVGTSINSTINTHISSYHSMMTGLASQVHGQLENMNQNWSAHANHVGDMMSDMSGHVSDFASDFSSAMGDVISDANDATSALEDLKSAIDALQSKTITIRVNAVGSGLQYAATGMNEVVRGPTLIMAGEEGAEHVRITPLTGKGSGGGGGGAQSNIMSGFGGMNFVAAAKGMDKIVTPWDNKAVSTFAGERGHRVREIKDEMEDEDKMVVRVDKVYRGAKITKEEWNRFAKEYGFKVKDIDKKKYGHEVDFKMMKNVRPLAADLDEPEGFTGGIGDMGGGRGGGGFGDEDFGGGGGGGGVGAGRAEEAAGGLQRPVRPGAGGTGGGGGGTVTAGGTSGITKIVFNGPITVQTALDVTLEIDHQKFGKLSRQVVSEGYGQTK